MEQIKEKITDYWSQRARDFGALRLKELQGSKGRLWMAELEKYIPMDRSLRILDLGTGTGFFTFLLASRGHQVTGIDLTEEMILQAGQTARVLGIQADFQVMDAEQPCFPPESFDVLISRNLTWNLPHLKEAYRAWKKLLKPGGILLNFDGDYCHEKEEDPASLPPSHAHKHLSRTLMDQYRELKGELKTSQQIRPVWDIQLLSQAGFSSIQMDPSLWKRIYSMPDEFYNPTPVFAIAAYA